MEGRRKEKVERRRMKRMKGNEEILKNRVVKIDSEKNWDFFVSHAANLKCPVVVHFTACWCMPSVAMNPFFRKMASTYQDILFLVVDVDEVKEVASKMEIKAMPTFVLMRQGEQVDKLVGANPDEMKKRIHAFLHSIRSQQTY